MQDNIGRRIDGKYEITELIACGAVVNIYKGIDIINNITIAIFLEKDEMDESYSNYKNEFTVIVDFASANLLNIYKKCFSAKKWYIIMDYIDAVTVMSYFNDNSDFLFFYYPTASTSDKKNVTDSDIIDEYNEICEVIQKYKKSISYKFAEKSIKEILDKILAIKYEYALYKLKVLEGISQEYFKNNERIELENTELINKLNIIYNKYISIKNENKKLDQELKLLRKELSINKKTKHKKMRISSYYKLTKEELKAFMK